MKTKLTNVLAMAMSAFWAAGCGFGDAIDDVNDGIDNIDDAIDDINDTIGDLSVEGTAILRDLFPDLSDAELLEISVNLDMDDLIALRDELGPVREAAAEFSAELFVNASEMVKTRKEELASQNNGYPETIAPIGRAAFYNETSKEASIVLSGIFRNEDGVDITNDNLVVTVDGEVQSTTTTCLYQGETVDIVFLLDVTGSMSNVIKSVRESIVAFVDAIVASGLQGTIGIVTFQDSVGVNVSFQEPAPADNVERSPFFAPVAIDNAGQIDDLRKFINRLEANRGADAPENLAGAIDFARNNVIGYTSNGAPNVIDGSMDPPATAPYPALTSDRQVFVAFTDITHHADSRDESNSSLQKEFVPRTHQDILGTLLQTNTIVNVSDPSWVDQSVTPTGDADEVAVDGDYWAIQTGGVGEDIASGYSLVDLELVVTASDTGLLDITLDNILQSTCYVAFDAALSTNAEATLSLTEGGETFDETLSFNWF